MVGSEEIVGGIVAVLVAIYGVHKKFKSDGVESVNQKAEINIIESLIKQRDDAMKLSDSYREKLILSEGDIREIRNKLDLVEIENFKLLEKIDHNESESLVLREIINYLTDTVSITRQSIESNENKAS